MSLAAIATSAIGNVKSEIGGDKKHQVKISFATFFTFLTPKYPLPFWYNKRATVNSVMKTFRVFFGIFSHS